MRPIGFSTGALAYADFGRALRMLRAENVPAVELSALRQGELVPLLEALDQLDLSQFEYISIHAPSNFEPSMEEFFVTGLASIASRGWPIIVHPDAICDYSRWRSLGPWLCVENMDKRKPIGRTAAELKTVFENLPDASFCFDIGHARQFDSTMTEAYLLLKAFGPRMRQVHVSEVNTRSKHDALSYASILAFREVAHLIPENIPLILETPVSQDHIAEEIERARDALPLPVAAG